MLVSQTEATNPDPLLFRKTFGVGQRQHDMFNVSMAFSTNTPLKFIPRISAFATTMTDQKNKGGLKVNTVTKGNHLTRGRFCGDRALHPTALYY